MKRKRATLYKKIFIILLVILTLTTAVIDILRYVAFRRENRRHAEEITRQSVTQLSYLLNKDEVDACIYEPDSDKANELREKLIKISVENNLKYIYIYLPDFENGTAVYCLAVASDSDVNKELMETRYAGIVVDLADDIIKANENAWNKSGYTTLRYENKYGDVITSFAALSDKGENYAIVGVDYNSKGITPWSLRALFVKMAVSLVIFIIVFVVIITLIKKRVVKPILYISERMCKFTTDIEERDFTPLQINTGDEIENVAESFNMMATEISSYIEEVKKWAAEEAKISTEFDVARRIQYGVVAERKDITIYEGLSLSGRMSPAKQVGGDFYDSFELPDGRYCVLIGDVSGKGIGAAMFMMHVKAILHEKLISVEDLSVAVKNANDELCGNNPENMFATVFVAIFDATKDVIKYVNAGHNEPVIIRNNEAVQLKVQTGIALGLFDGMDFVLEETEFSSDTALYIYTDGVTDCVNEDNEFWGKERMLNTLSSCDTNASSGTFCDTVIDELKKYRGKAEAFDDITMVCVRKK